MRGLWRFIGVLFCLTALSAQAQDAGQFIGRWESRDQAGLALELFAEGDGVAYQTDEESFPVTWTADMAAEPIRLRLTINGQTRISLVRFDAPDRITMTEPRSEAPEGFDDINLMLLYRVDG